jgi:predicted GNAT family acetyltransferase
LRHPDGVPGRLRRAGTDDAERLIEWMRGFEVDTGGVATTPETLRRRIGAGLVWTWDHGEPVAMAALTTPLAGTTRVGLVYTPPEHRRHGYAAACTAAVSQVGLDTGAQRCILYTQLGNPQSNAIYRSLGYEPIQETVHYRFG